MVYSRKTIIFQGSMGDEGLAFSRGVQLLIPMETYRTCNFPGRIPTPCHLSGSVHV